MERRPSLPNALLRMSSSMDMRSGSTTEMSRRLIRLRSLATSRSSDLPPVMSA